MHEITGNKVCGSGEQSLNMAIGQTEDLSVVVFNYRIVFYRSAYISVNVCTF